MNFILRYELTNGAKHEHLSRKSYECAPELAHYKNSYRVSECARRNGQCHNISTRAVTSQSSPQSHEESKSDAEETLERNSRKNNYQYFSDSELCKMPSDFENSCLKNSFSMSSLQPSSRVRLEQSSQATTHPIPALPNRAYNSLTHKLRKRSSEQESWRNSWGHEDRKDEFWTSFESNYQYLMNNNLIDSCKEARNDLSISHDWTFSRFKQQFLELDAWLNSIKNTIHTNEGNQTVRNAKLNQLEKMKRKNYQKKNFLSQSSRLVTCCSEHKDEILDYISQLNTKWDSLMQAFASNRNMGDDCYSMSIEIHCELHCLSKWVEAMESKIEPLNFRRKWSLRQLKQKAKEHRLVQKDVESHGKTILSVIKLCERYSQCKQDPRIGVLEHRQSPLERAQRWERRWHLLYLKCLEWQFYIEEQINNFKSQNFDCAGADSDDEQPASKHRRLSGPLQNSRTRCPFVSKNEEGKSYDLMDVGDDMTVTRAEPALNDIEMLQSDRRRDDVVTSPISLLQTTMTTTTTTTTATPTPTNADAPLNEKFRDALRNLSAETLSKMIPPDFAMFNTTDVSSRNVGVYYIPHEDTDTEQEAQAKAKRSKTWTTDESSDDEWTYKNLEHCSADDTDVSQRGNSPNGEAMTVCDEAEDKVSRELRDQSKKVLDSEKLEPGSIQRLVDRADELVQTTPKRLTPRKKCSGSGPKVRQNEQVREWLRKCQPAAGDYNTTAAISVGDSCDASSEYTTEDDDRYDRHSSCDQTLTMIGSSQGNGIDDPPVTEFVPIVEATKVTLRNKLGARKSRPFSTSELLYLSRVQLSSTQWVSESALNKMLTPSLKDAQSALSSSTIEECSTRTPEGSSCNMSSLRRRRLRQRRRSSTLGRKGHSGSADSLSTLSYLETTVRQFFPSAARAPPPVPAPPLHRLKCNSFSEPTMTRQRLSSAERAIVSDPANCEHACNSTSGTETEEEQTRGKKCWPRKKLLALPAFRLGPQHGVVTRRAGNATLSATSAEEHFSSFSENAWDDFQERYVSEAYSEEPVDVDQVKKLTEFGDDYRKYIDSHSDCASSFSRRCKSIRCGRYHDFGVDEDDSSPPDSDSDLEDVRKLLQRSHAQLCCSQQLFAKQTAKPYSCFHLSESDFADLRNTCRENVRCLRLLLERIEVDGPLFPQQRTSDIRRMLSEWEALEETSDELERKCLLQRDIMELQKTLREMSDTPITSVHIEDRLQLENNVKVVKAELDSIGEMKNLINEYKALADQLAKDAKCPSLSLEDDMSGLYQIWTDAQQKTARDLTMLEQALSMWSEFDRHMLELKVVLREDYTALNALDQALKTEDGNVDMASAMQNIVKYLPESRRDGQSMVHNSRGMSQVDGVSSLLRSTLNAEGSFSDSGISDSGSEQDVFDREKHLALLRKLARHLEAILAPGSDALLNIMKKIDEAEEEIRELQQTYRTIKTDYLEKSERCSQQLAKGPTTSSTFQKDVDVDVGRGTGTCPGDPGADPSRERSMFWRVLRAALPFHMVFVVFLCVACLLEQPNCCDTINNLNLSWSPRLRHISGPPPT